MANTKKTIVEETVVADSSHEVKMAVMNNDIKHINETLVRLEGKFDVAIQSFATNQQLLDAITASDLKHKEYEKTIDFLQTTVQSLKEKDAEQQGTIEANRRFTNVTLTILGIIITGLCTYLGIRGIK